MALQPFGCGLIGPKVKELTMPGGVFFGLHLLGCDLDAASSLWWLPRITIETKGILSAYIDWECTFCPISRSMRVARNA